MSVPEPSFMANIRLEDKELQKQKIKQVNQTQLSKLSKTHIQILLYIIELIQCSPDQLESWKQILTEQYAIAPNQ